MADPVNIVGLVAVMAGAAAASIGAILAFVQKIKEGSNMKRMPEIKISGTAAGSNIKIAVEKVTSEQANAIIGIVSGSTGDVNEVRIKHDKNGDGK